MYEPVLLTVEGQAFVCCSCSNHKVLTRHLCMCRFKRKLTIDTNHLVEVVTVKFNPSSIMPEFGLHVDYMP